MTKEVLYKYFGTNGTILTTVHLEDVYYIRMLSIAADDDKQLTKNGKQFYRSIIIPEEELLQWYEVSR